jgi:membrane-bound ClpP family serine protease
LTSPSSQKKEDGYTNSFGWESLVGENGVSDTDLHPSGWIIAKKKRLFVLSEGKFIEKGSNVEILSVNGNRILVREVKEIKKGD